jgi:hypothetical protein
MYPTDATGQPLLLRDFCGNSIAFEDEYEFGIRLFPVDIEANHDLDNVDYTLKLQVGLGVPFSKDLARLVWSARPDSDVAPLVAEAMQVFVGYTRVEPLIDDDDTGDVFRNRLDGELLFNLPVNDLLDISANWRSFYSLDDGAFDDLLEVGGKFYLLGDGRKSAVTLSYLSGSMPPDFEEADSVRLGFTVKFGGD